MVRLQTGLVLACFLASSLAADDSPSLGQIAGGQAKIVDLTYTLNEHNPYWPGDNYQPFELKTIATLEEDGVLSKLLILPEHLGTHIDAPNHFEADRPAVDQIPPEDLFAPGVVIDIALQAEQDADYALSLADLERWEREHGRIPDKAVVLVHTGWGRFWTNYDRYKNQDVHGTLHFPGVSKEAAEFLVRQRDIRGMGIDTLSIDPGTSKDFAVHHVLNKARRYALENVARLDELPAKGFDLIIAPIKVERGTGGPTRIFAVMPRDEP
jgi:kynurenine formamidase